MFIDTVNEFGLEQQVYECTRGNHILDVVFASQPNVINNIFTILRMSDHDAISFEVLTSLEKHKLQKRKIFQYYKADKDGILSAMAEFFSICYGWILQKVFWTGSMQLNNSRQLASF